MNRIEMAIVRRKATIEQRVKDGLTTIEKVEATRQSLDMEVYEFVKFQELKSLAVAEGKLSLEEGMTIYNYLGESPTTFNGQSVEVKVTLTELLGELLKKHINRHR